MGRKKFLIFLQLGLEKVPNFFHIEPKKVSELYSIWAVKGSHFFQLGRKFLIFMQFRVMSFIQFGWGKFPNFLNSEFLIFIQFGQEKFLIFVQIKQKVLDIYLIWVGIVPIFFKLGIKFKFFKLHRKFLIFIQFGWEKSSQFLFKLGGKFLFF